MLFHKYLSNDKYLFSSPKSISFNKDVIFTTRKKAGPILDGSGMKVQTIKQRLAVDIVFDDKMISKVS